MEDSSASTLELRPLYFAEEGGGQWRPMLEKLNLI
jgi:hypothetical protein